MRSLLSHVRGSRRYVSGWVETCAPNLHGKWISHLCLRCEEWLSTNYHDIYRGLRECPDSLQRYCIRWLVPRGNRQISKAFIGERGVETDVIYVGYGSRIDTLKDIIGLRTYSPDLNITYLYRSTGPNIDLYSPYCGLVEWYSTADLFATLKAASASVLIVSSKMAHQDVLLTELAWSGKTIYRANEFARRSPRGTLADEVFEVEEHMLKRCDGICHIYDDSAMDKLIHELGLHVPAVSVRPQCISALGPNRHLPRLSEIDGQTHIVYVASVAPKAADSRFAGHAKQIYNWRTIVGCRGVHLHVYDAFGVLLDRTNPEFEEYRVLAEESDQFHIERFVPYEMLLEKLTQYDWGLPYFDLTSRNLIREGFFTAIGNNYFTYLQAGLPVIVSPTSVSMTEIAERLRVGVSVSFTELPKLSETLLAKDIEMLRANVQFHATAGELRFQTKELGQLVCGQIESTADQPLAISD